jgi:alpha-ribazole phosphatase
MHLWMIRHAKPVVATGVCYGALDLPADDAANEQAARHLARSLPHALLVLHSPALRCAQLALRLHQLRPDLQLHAASDLREMNFGRWEGMPWTDIAHSQLQAWTDDFENYRCGGHGDCAQDVLVRAHSAAQHTARLLNLNDTVDSKHQAVAVAVPQAAWITHAGVLRATAWLAPRWSWSRPLALPLCLRADAWPQDALPFGQYHLMHWPPHPLSP